MNAKDFDGTRGLDQEIFFYGSLQAMQTLVVGWICEVHSLNWARRITVLTRFVASLVSQAERLAKQGNTILQARFLF